MKHLNISQSTKRALANPLEATGTRRGGLVKPPRMSELTKKGGNVTKRSSTDGHHATRRHVSPHHPDVINLLARSAHNWQRPRQSWPALPIPSLTDFIISIFIARMSYLRCSIRNPRMTMVAWRIPIPGRRMMLHYRPRIVPRFRENWCR